jgi:hypothetical protein
MLVSAVSARFVLDMRGPFGYRNVGDSGTTEHR